MGGLRGVLAGFIFGEGGEERLVVGSRGGCAFLYMLEAAGHLVE